MINDRNTVTHLIRLGHVVRCEQHRATRLLRLEGTDALAHIACRRDIESNRWLIKEEHPRLIQE